MERSRLGSSVGAKCVWVRYTGECKGTWHAPKFCRVFRDGLFLNLFLTHSHHRIEKRYSPANPYLRRFFTFSLSWLVSIHLKHLNTPPQQDLSI